MLELVSSGQDLIKLWPRNLRENMEEKGSMRLICFVLSPEAAPVDCSTRWLLPYMNEYTADIQGELNARSRAQCAISCICVSGKGAHKRVCISQGTVSSVNSHLQ